MTRPFITLYLLLATALFGYWLIAEFTPELVLRPMELEYSHQNYRGTRYMLDQRVEGLDAAAIDKQVAEIKTLFEYPIDLVDEASLMLTRDEAARLDQNQLVARTVDGADQGIYNSVVNGKAWVFDSDQTQSEHNRRISIGTFRMVEQRLRRAGSDQRSDALAEMNAEFGFPIVLETVNQTEIAEELRAKLVAGEVVGVDVNSDSERYFYPSSLPGPENRLVIIRFGPIDFPLSVPLLVASFLAILALLVGVAILLWIKPFWNSLGSLGDAARRFGQGDFSARVNYGRRSGIREIGATFNTMAERIQNLLGSHRELTNAVSHELRTPLSRIRFSMEMLQTSDNRDDQDRHMNNISDDVNELDSLVAELLTYARFDRDPGKIRTEQLHLPSWLKTEVGRLQGYVDKPFVLSYEESAAEGPSMVMAEPRLLSRALTNLVQNGLRYAKRQVIVRLSTGVGEVVICVDDDGSGIPLGDRQKVFDPFSRLDQSRNRLSGGAGLGLSIVKQVVEWHVGSVSVSESPEGGARFRIVLPVSIGTDMPMLSGAEC